MAFSRCTGRRGIHLSQPQLGVGTACFKTVGDVNYCQATLSKPGNLYTHGNLIHDGLLTAGSRHLANLPGSFISNFAN